MTDPISPDPSSPDLEPAQESTAAPPSRINRWAASTTVIVTIWAVTAGLSVLFLASIVILGIRSYDYSTSLHNSSVSQCQANNTNRREDIAIWNQFLGDLAPPGAPQSAKVKAELTRIYGLIRTKDTPRNCVKVYAP
jgi:hypothetical protein